MVGKLASGCGGSSTTLTFAAVLLFFHDDRQLLDISNTRPDYDAYHGLDTSLEPGSGTDLVALLGEDTLWAQVGMLLSSPRRR